MVAPWRETAFRKPYLMALNGGSRLPGMLESSDIQEQVRFAAKQRILFLPHAVRQISRPDRMISIGDVRAVVTKGEVIEDYPEDARGHSCLMLRAGGGNRAIHVVCAPKDEYLAIITAYVPSSAEWDSTYRKRRSA